ncbi:hypothetical protein KP509_15G018900 [Ceratopteris richardii]|nr:hypothetical protein KP509_15G018900 [Ceratopteris richardii]
MLPLIVQCHIAQVRCCSLHTCMSHLTQAFHRILLVSLHLSPLRGSNYAMKQDRQMQITMEHNKIDTCRYRSSTNTNILIGLE